MNPSARPIEPAHLDRYLGTEAPNVLNEYFNSGRYTGGRFERFAGGGDGPHVADRITSDDIVAVSLLGVRIPGQPALAILEERPTPLSALLADIPVAVDLWDAPEQTVSPDSPADQLWRNLNGLPGVGWVTAGKLLARKRPRLIPVYDRVVKAALGRPDGDEWWRPLRVTLVENPEIITRLEELRTGAGVGQDVTLLRILDVCIWMGANGKEEAVPD